MKLYYRDQMLGEVSDYYGQDLWMNGRITFSEAGKSFRPFFEWMVDETQGGEEPPFSPDVLDSKNWYLVDDQGNQLGIDVPPVHVDLNDISWKWRGEDETAPCGAAGRNNCP